MSKYFQTVLVVIYLPDLCVTPDTTKNLYHLTEEWPLYQHKIIVYKDGFIMWEILPNGEESQGHQDDGGLHPAPSANQPKQAGQYIVRLVRIPAGRTEYLQADQSTRRWARTLAGGPEH
jgi:hypothetical protein